MKSQYRVIFSLSTAFILLAATSRPAFAGPYTDNLTQCFVSKTTPEQKAVLMEWIFSEMSLNPAVTRFASIPDAKRKEFNVNMANLFMSLLTVTCKQETNLAVKNEGSQAIGVAFSVLSQMAGRELSSSPEVAKGMSELSNYVDMNKLNTVLHPTN